MALTVAELMASKGFQVFKLVAGEAGMNNTIGGIGILDYEYAEEDERRETIWKFHKKDFVISSLLFAKGHPERILSAIKGLCRDCKCPGNQDNLLFGIAAGSIGLCRRKRVADLYFWP